MAEVQETNITTDNVTEPEKAATKSKKKKGKDTADGFTDYGNGMKVKRN